MRNESITDVTTNTAYATSFVGFVVGLVKSIDWVMVATIIVPIIVSLMNAYYKKKESEKNDLEKELIKQRIDLERRKYDEELKMAINNANRKLEMDFDIKNREIEILKRQNEELRTMLLNKHFSDTA